MKTRIESCTDPLTKEGRQVIAAAAGILRQGGLVAFPTETVYGLGADAFNGDACKKIFAAKGRPSDNPLIVHIADTASLEKITAADERTYARAHALADAFWPGPLTMILKRKDTVPSAVTGGLDTVAVRLPANDTARALITAAGTPVAAPSANRSGRPSPTSARHVTEDLDGRVEMIIDGGDTQVGLESTIVDLSAERITVLRQGMISASQIALALGMKKEEIVTAAHTNDHDAPKAPGMKYRHYAPKAALHVVDGKKDRVISYINDKTAADHENGYRTGVIVPEDAEARYHADVMIAIGTDDEAAAHNLYRALRDMDAQAVDIIYAEAFPHPAVMDRLTRASAGNIIEFK